MSEKELLNVKDLVVDVEEKEILHGVNLTIRPGETHVLMGPVNLHWAIHCLAIHATR